MTHQHATSTSSFRQRRRYSFEAADVLENDGHSKLLNLFMGFFITCQALAQLRHNILDAKEAQQSRE